MGALFRCITTRHLTLSPIRTLLTLAGIVLGVAVVFAIDVVNGSVVASFEHGVAAMTGKTALVVGEDTGVDEAMLESVRAVPGVALAVPVIQESVRERHTGRRLAVLAVDALLDSDVRDYEVWADDIEVEDELAFLNDPHAVLITRRFAAEAGVKAGDELELTTPKGPATFNIRGLLEPQGAAQVFGGDMLLMDVFAAQIAFDRGRRFDTIDVVADRGVNVDAVAARIDQALQHRADVRRPRQRTAQAERILSGFQLGLSVASLVAIFVGAFIVYNAMAISVAQRRTEIGILRALGATRSTITALFMGEGLALGALGSALGVLAGGLLARASLAHVGESVSEIYLQVRPERLEISDGHLARAAAVGIGATLIATFLPARKAAAAGPAVVMKPHQEVSGQATGRLRSTHLSVAFACAALAVAALAHLRQDFHIGVMVQVLLSLSAAFTAPALARGLSRLVIPIAGRNRPALRLGILAFARNAERNAVAIAALGLALANVVNVASFLASVKQNTVDWFERSLRADILVFAGESVTGKFERPLPPSLQPKLAAMEGVALVDPLRMAKQTYRGQPFYLFSYDLENYRRFNEIPVVAGDLDHALDAIAQGEGIAASQSFARQFDVGLGDALSLQTPRGPRTFEISIIYADYSAELGILTTTREIYRRIWGDDLVDSFGIYTTAGTDLPQLRKRILSTIGPQHDIAAIENSEYRAQVLGLFDRSFALMRALELVAVIVALLGIINTLTVSVMDRTVEIGVLKAIGAARRQVQSMFVTESMLIAAAAVVLSIGGGAALSLYTVKELLRFQMGWSIAWQPSLSVIAEVAVMALLVGLVGSWLPTRRATKLDVVDALQHE